MIARISGKLIEKKQNAVILETGGLAYEVFLPVITLARLNELTPAGEEIRFITYHYHQMEPSRSTPVLIGFLNEVERDFFEVFITVSGIGPKAALRALNAPISLIARAIDEADIAFLRSLPGIGPQRAKEIIAKLQGKVGRFGLIQDGGAKATPTANKDMAEEALSVLMQLQYKRHEAREMVAEALKKNPDAQTVEHLLNAVYRQKNQRS